MSLLEDVFLQDETEEAQELERIIEGDEYDVRPNERSDSDDNSEKEDEAEEDKRRVEPTSAKAKRVIKNPRFILNPARLTGPRGIQVIPEHFKDFKFKGKGHEKEDLDLVLKKLEHWAYRLYPKFEFGDCLKKIETLGKKRPVMVHLHKIRSDQLVTEETVVQRDSTDDEAPPPEEDEFDKLLAEQIELARNTPAPGSVKKGFETPAANMISPNTMPKATSSPSISDEQKERMMRNRKLAEERRLARLKAQTQNASTHPTVPENQISAADNESNSINNSVIINGDEDEDEIRTRKNWSKVIDSSDSENDITDNITVINDKTSDKEDTTNALDDGTNEKRARKNKPNVIDSSDSENEMIIDETTRMKTSDLIDITNGSENRKIVNNFVDISAVGEPNVVHDQNDIIDITKGYENTRKETEKDILIVDKIIDITDGQKSRESVSKEIIDINEAESRGTLTTKSQQSNLIDSSDSEDDFAVTAINDTVAVDVHTNPGQSQTQNRNYTKELPEKHDYIEKSVKSTNEDKIYDVSDKANKNSKSVFTDAPNENTDFETNKNIETNQSSDIVVNTQDNSYETNAASGKSVNQQNDGDCGPKESGIDNELMCVDFSDDF